MNLQVKKTRKQVGFLILTAFTLTLLLSLSITPAAYAGEFIEGGPDAVLEKDQVIQDDLFIAGNDVSVAGVVEGDLFAVGENVDISGTVNGNVFIAGQTVTVSGKIDGALMIGGFDLILEDGASISRNVYFGGFSFQTMADSLVNRSIYGGGYQMILGGTVGRDITAGLAALEISGPVGGDVSAEIGETTDNSFTPFTFWSPGMPSINVLDPGYTVDEDQIEGEVNLKEVPVDTELETNIRVDPGFFIFQSVRRRVGEFIALLLVGALAIWLARGSLLKAVSEVKNNAGMDTIWGILVYVLYIPVVFLLFFVLLIITILISLVTLGNLAGEMITISSISFFGLLTLFGMLTSLATKVVLGTLAGRWILEKTTKLNFGNFWHYVGALAIGVFIYEVLRAIPFFGWLLMVVVVVIGTGAIFVLIKNSLKKNVSTPSEDIEATPT